MDEISMLSRRSLSLFPILLLGAFSCAALALPTADEVLEALSISDFKRDEIRSGEIVRWTAEEGSKRELAVGVALLVRDAPENLAELFRQAATYQIVTTVTAYGEISEEGTAADFARVKLVPNGEKETKRYLGAKPGDKLNLDAKEISAWQALKSEGGSKTAVEELVREQLLARYQAYRQGGLSGIPAYERRRGKTFQLSQDLLSATNQAKVLAKFFPSFHQILLKYPAIGDQQLENWFHWINVDVFNRPTFILSHRMLFNEGDVYITADRHFYASHEYNGLQSIGGALPTENGTLLVILYRISTDGVAGLGSAVKHPVARGLMGPYMEEMFEGIRAQVK